MISDSNEQLQQELEYTLLKPDCHSWWISKMQSGREDSLEEWYAIKVRKSMHQSWLAKRLGVGLLCWGFMGVQQEIRLEEASILQIGSVSFPAGRCTSLQLHPCHKLFDRDGHQHSSPAPLQSLLPVTFGYSLSSEAVVMRHLRR